MQLSLASVLGESARYHPTAIALVAGDVRYTYAELWAEALAAAGALRDLGIGKGDHVALIAPNTPDFVISYFAVQLRGGVIVPVPPMLVPDEIAYLLADSGSRLVLANPVHVDAARKATEIVGVPLVPTVPAAGTGPDLATLAAAARPQVGITLTTADDPSVLFYTSGTTGKPKGAILTQGNLVMNAMVTAFKANNLRSDDVVLASLPLFHTFGQSVVMNACFMAGGRVVLQAQFNAAQAWDLMLAEGVTILRGVPTMYIALLDEHTRRLAAAGGEAVPIPSVRFANSGGAPLPLAVAERFRDELGITVQEGYGLSETSPAATLPQDAFPVAPGSVGYPIWGVDVEITQADVEDVIELVPAGELGEIVVRGHNVFAGYHGRPEATAAAFVDGWFRTGDLGRKDPVTGAISIVDRKKDLIIRGGYNVYPRELEEVLVRHPGIAQVAAIGLPDPVLGEEVLAVVVPADPASPPDPEEIIAWSRQHLAKHKYPRRIEFVTELPLGPTRKVLKRELRARFA